MKKNQTAKVICLYSLLGFAVPVGFGQTETNDTSDPPTPPVKEQQVEPTPSKEESKSQEPQVVLNGEVMIEEQNKLIRKNQNNLIKSLDSVATEIQKSNKQLENGEVMIEEQNKLIHSNQNDLIKSLDSIVTEIQKSNKQLEESVKSMSQQQASLAAQLAEVSKRLDETIKGVQTNADQATATLKTSFEAKIEQLSSQIATNQENVKALQDKHSDLLSKLTDSTDLANEGVNENKALLGKIQSENSQLQEKISNIDNEIEGLEARANENHEKVQGALGSISSKLVLSFVLKTIVILAAFGLGFYVWKNKQMIASLITGKNNSDQIQFESIFKDERYLDGLNRVVDLLNATGQAGPAQEQDHGLPLSVADEINRMRVRLSKMEKEDDVKVKPLQKALERMQEKLESMGYEIIDLMDKPFVEGMSANPQFIPDDTLSEGESIIRRVITPLVNFKGKLLQPPEVEVRVGE